MVDNGNGTYSVTVAYKGRPESIRTGSGTRLLRDVGIIVIANTFDSNGTANLNDDIVLSARVISIKGSAPDAESDVQLFCQVVRRALI